MTEAFKAGALSARRSRLIALTLALLCVLSLFLRYELRYGPRPYLFYGDPATGLPEADAVTWNLHALNLVEGRGFGDYLKQFRSRNYIPPGHPFLLGFLYFFLGPDPRAAGWGIAVMGSLLPLIAYLWAREMWGRRIGLITATLAAVHPPYFHIGYSLMSEPTTVFTTAIALWLGARLLRRPGWGTAVAAGLVFGGSALVRPSALAFLWGVALALLFVPGLRPGRRILWAGVLILCSLLPLGAWQYRNYRAHGEAAALYSSISARHAWHGAHPQYGPGFYSRSAWHETLWRDPRASELAMIRRMQQETSRFIRADRLRYVMSCIWRMKALTPEFMRRAADIRWSHGGVGRIHFMILVTLALAGLLQSLPLRARVGSVPQVREMPGTIWAFSLLAGLALAYLGAGVYGAADRYRWPLEYVLLPFAAVFLDALWRLTTEPVFEQKTIISAWPVGFRMVRLLKMSGGLALAVMVLVYAGTLVARHRRPSGPEETAPRLAQETIRKKLEEGDLLGEFENQQPRWISYEDVFEEQARNDGALTTLNGQLVVWWGRLRFVRCDDKGRLESGYVILTPCPGDFGGARLSFLRHPDAVAPARQFRDGDVVTFIARLHYRRRPIETPDLVFYDVLPGRFDRPAETQSSRPRKQVAPESFGITDHALTRAATGIETK